MTTYTTRLPGQLPPGAPGTQPAATRLDSPRVESSGAGPAAARSIVSPRVETDQAAPAASVAQPSCLDEHGGVSVSLASGGPPVSVKVATLTDRDFCV
ncbi:hypothetical protein [Kitasatospora sp. NPDC017646]|uniref:hypothetical protein n=1 Tax=Kitasatospora sp. NPDC017646 TaxID=3364024 RepID=UPI0037BA9B85